MKKKKKKRPPTISKLKKKLDIPFSKYIRLKETDGGKQGRCITCGRTKNFKELDAGHFISRNWYRTRWDERNVHIQCIQCNRFVGGEIDEYFLWMVDKYGRKEVEEMINRKHDVFLLERKWLEEQIEIYKEKVKELSA